MHKYEYEWFLAPGPTSISLDNGWKWLQQRKVNYAIQATNKLLSLATNF